MFGLLATLILCLRMSSPIWGIPTAYPGLLKDYFVPNGVTDQLHLHSINPANWMSRQLHLIGEQTLI